MARVYFIDSSQTMTARDGTSLLGYVHAIKILLGEARDVLLIGGGGALRRSRGSRRNASARLLKGLTAT